MKICHDNCFIPYIQYKVYMYLHLVVNLESQKLSGKNEDKKSFSKINFNNNLKFYILKFEFVLLLGIIILKRDNQTQKLAFIVDSILCYPPPSTDQTNTTGCSIHSNPHKVLCESQRENRICEWKWLGCVDKELSWIEYTTTIIHYRCLGSWSGALPLPHIASNHIIEWN